MNFLLSLMFLASFHAVAETHVKLLSFSNKNYHFQCDDEAGPLVIYVDVMIEDEKNYLVVLKNSEFKPMEILRSEVKFKDDLDLLSLSATGKMDAFWLEKNEKDWNAGYSFDFWQTRMKCHELIQ